MNATIKADHIPAIGEKLPGGFYAGMISDGNAQWALVLAPKWAGIIENQWGRYGETIKCTNSTSNGMANTIALTQQNCPIGKWAFNIAVDSVGGFYIPARDELEIIYRNLKPSGDLNSCMYRDGENPSAAHQIDRYAYTPNQPTITRAALFKSGAKEALEEKWYWSSTQINSHNAWAQDFYEGGQCASLKHRKLCIRPIRRMMII